MANVILNKFDGGTAEEKFTTSLYQSESSRNFDIFSEPHRLLPIPDSIAEVLTAGDIDDYRPANVVLATVSAATVLVTVGNKQDGSKTQFHYKTGVVGNFTESSFTDTNNLVKGTLITYKKYAYAVDTNGSTSCRLLKYSGATVDVIGTITDFGNGQVRVFVHPETNILYVFVGTTIATYNGTDFVETDFAVTMSGYTFASVAGYGKYIAIAMNSTSNNQPICVLWGMDVSIIEFQGYIDLGEGTVAIVENLDNTLVFVMTASLQYGTPNENTIIIKSYSGGAVETVKEIAALTSASLYSFKAKSKNKLYFALANSYCIYCFGKNKEGYYSITEDRFLTTGGLLTSVTSLSIIGNVKWVGTVTSGGVFTLRRTMVSTEPATYSNTSIYVSTKNPAMAIDDRTKLKRLEAIQISYTAGTLTGRTTNLKYSVDGGTMASILSDINATSGAEIVIEATNDANGDAFLEGRDYQFQVESIGGNAIKEIKYKYSNQQTQF